MLVHGAGSGPWVFERWGAALPGMEVATIDLHDDLDVACSSMQDYADSLIEACIGLRPPLFVCGWSMGGLVALMACPSLELAGLILLEPSPPDFLQERREIEEGFAVVSGVCRDAHYPTFIEEVFGVIELWKRAEVDSGDRGCLPVRAPRARSARAPPWGQRG